MDNLNIWCFGKKDYFCSKELEKNATMGQILTLPLNHTKRMTLDNPNTLTWLDVIKYILMPVLTVILGTAWIIKENRKARLASEAKEDAKDLEKEQKLWAHDVRNDINEIKGTMQLLAETTKANFTAQNRMNEIFINNFEEVKKEYREGFTEMKKNHRDDILTVHKRIDGLEGKPSHSKNKFGS